MIENVLTLLMLILLQAVLGFDNLLYISLESKRAPIEDQKKEQNDFLLHHLYPSGDRYSSREVSEKVT